MNCPNCETDNRPGAKFCNKCGCPLPQACSSCGVHNRPGAKFCDSCGSSLTASSQEIPQPAVQETQPIAVPSLSTEPQVTEAERRQLTVMFCDLVGSTHLSGQLDPEELRDVVRAYQAASAEAIQRFEGYVAQHLGDGLLVYFGYPVAHEDDAQRAVRAGLGIINAMKALNQRLAQSHGMALAVRIGIHTGLVVIGDIGAGLRQEQLALGETPNIAARIQSLAAPDTVVISLPTFELIQGYFACQTLGAQALRGVAQPMDTYRVLRASGAQDRLDVTVAFTPLVSRESEIALLVERWEQAKAGMGQMVVVSGEAGIGKSRLVQVLKAHVAGEAHTRWECRSSPYYQNTALYPLMDLLQRTSGFTSDDGAEEKLEKLERTLGQYRFPLSETIPLFASFFSLTLPERHDLPQRLTPQQQRQKTLEMTLAILLEHAERELVLFILEDLHWTDPTTLEFLELLLEQMPTIPILTLVTCRPTFQPQWGQRSYLTPIALNRLPRPQIERMIEGITDGKRMPDEVLVQIVEKADGVPLFVEELTKATLESEMLQEVNGQYELVDSHAALAVPMTLQDSLMARLDRLGDAKGVAQLGAVIGRQFTYELLSAIASQDEIALQRDLQRLVASELLYQRGMATQATYMFKHALIQDTAYHSLLYSTRQQVHQRLAQVLEGQFPDTSAAQPELLAHHYTEAGRSETAIAYWQRAGEQARAHSANEEAIAHLNQGLRLIEQIPETIDRMQRELTLQISLALAYHATKGQMAAEVRDAYGRARELCAQVGDDYQLFRVLMGLFRSHRPPYDLWPYLHELERVAERSQDPHLILESHMAQGTMKLHDGAFTDSRDHLERALALYDAHNHAFYASHTSLDPGVNSFSRLSWTLWFLGYPDQALTRSRETLALARELGHAYSLAQACNFAALLHQFRREPQAISQQTQAAIELSDEHALDQWQITANILSGWLFVYRGQGESGLTQMQQGLAAYAASGTTLYREWFLALLADAYGYYGQPKVGLSFLAEAITLVLNGEGWACWEPELYRFKGELLLRESSDNQSKAELCFHQALDTARRLQQAKSWELRTATSLARLWQSQNKRRDAYDLLAPVYAWFTEGFDTADLKDAKTLLDEVS